MRQMCRGVVFSLSLIRKMLATTIRVLGVLMKAGQYLFGFSGRINRAKIWLWVLIAIAFVIVMAVIAGLGFEWKATLDALKAQKGHAPIDWSLVPKPGCKGTVSLIAMIAMGLVAIAYLWAKLAVYAKRLHDRAKSAWWLVVYLGVPMALHGYGCHVAGKPCGGDPLHHLHAMTLPGKIACGLALLIGIWVFIDLFCLKGTKGANKYGADPLEPNWCDPEKPVKGCKPKPLGK